MAIKIPGYSGGICLESNKSAGKLPRPGNLYTKPGDMEMPQAKPPSCEQLGGRQNTTKRDGRSA
jgi:hypothetical protein